MEEVIKNFLPRKIRNLLRCVLFAFPLMSEYIYWFWRDLWYSSIYRSKKGEMAGLMINGHVLEKGITMPERRLGFGEQMVRNLINRTKNTIDEWGDDYVEVQAALNDLEQYLQIHSDTGYELSEDIRGGIKSLLDHKHNNTQDCYNMTFNDYFKTCSDFYEFAHQRHTVRWFSDKPINIQVVIKAIELAQTAPSACNRQSSKVYIISSNKKKQQVLGLQNGNRGFGHHADKIILITADMRFWDCMHRTSAYLDAGIFTMNLLYAFHYNKICACTLNAHLTAKKREKLRNIVGYSKSEIPVVFIAIGNAPDSFMIAGSQRLNTNSIYSIL